MIVGKSHDAERYAEQFFLEHVQTGSHDRSVLAVARGYVDGAAVHSLVLDPMPEETRRAVRVVQKSPPYGVAPVVTAPGLAPELKSAVRDALLQLHESSQGAALLQPLDIDRFVKPPEGFYRPIEELVDRWESRP